MRNGTSAILSGLGIIALLSLTPEPAAARGFGGFHGGGVGGFGGVRAGSFGERAPRPPSAVCALQLLDGPAGVPQARSRDVPVGVVRVGVVVEAVAGDGVGQLQPVSQPVSLWLVLGVGEAAVRRTASPG
jgi:hypothetical protein